MTMPSGSFCHVHQAFKELHGLIGEGKGQFEQGLYVNLFLINPSDKIDISSVLQRLKVSSISSE